MSLERRVYTAEFFMDLGFSREAAEQFARNWSKREAQTMEEVERGRRWEQKGREELARGNMKEEGG